ncbi:response regulator [Sinomicrobium kalidii]|uniref:response regulator n=1 Tax=Sinomicrobium kalidii TaxID=2900738 RepID=UPI001E61F473|nr:response regulator [Sinomicrobium kalidii]UGU16533.1 response regulator [Sinomicrobium kalidii]
MKTKNYHIALIDDHPLITDAYKNALEYVSEQDGTTFNIVVAHSCDEARYILDNASPLHPFDIVFLDIQLPPSGDSDIISGEDLGLEIRKRFPRARIAVSTTFNDHYRIHSIFESLNPDGFLIKGDITPDELITAIRHLIAEPPYYSKTVMQSLRQYITSDFLLDKIDRQLLYQLSLGTKMKTITTIIPLSRAAIEKRKRHLKDIFDVESGEDRDLILRAREKGFI